MDIKDELYQIIGAAMEVHRELKQGLNEAVYQDALELEFRDRGIKYEREVNIPIQYKNHILDKYYRMDFLCFDEVVVELKSAEGITPEHRFQLFTYLRLTAKPFGLLINFGENSLHTERYQYDSVTNDCRMIPYR